MWSVALLPTPAQGSVRWGLRMSYVTKITLQSGDRAVLDETVAEIKTFVSRKGAEMAGPHPRPPTEFSVSQPKRLSNDGGRFDPWRYTVYTRELEIKGYDAVARTLATRDYPSSVHLSIQVDQIRSAH